MPPNQTEPAYDDSQEQTTQPEDQEAGKWMLPADYPGVENLKVGDSLSFKVAAKNEDGTVELDEVQGPKQKPIMKDFDESMSAPTAAPAKGY